MQDDVNFLKKKKKKNAHGFWQVTRDRRNPAAIWPIVRLIGF